jgi:hypothetical protein
MVRPYFAQKVVLRNLKASFVANFFKSFGALQRLRIASGLNYGGSARKVENRGTKPT